jgi:hypothetical protein
MRTFTCFLAGLAALLAAGANRSEAAGWPQSAPLQRPVR